MRIFVYIGDGEEGTLPVEIGGEYLESLLGQERWQYRLKKFIYFFADPEEING